MEKTEKVSAAVILASLTKRATPLKTAIAKIKVDDKDTYELKKRKVAELKELMKLAEEKEKSLLDPLDKVRKDIKELFAPFKQMVAKLEVEAKSEMLLFIDKAKVQKAKIQNDLSEGKIVKLETAVRRTNNLDVSGTRKIWVLEEVDSSLTPREFLVPDESAIKEALKSGKVVSGWKMVQQETIAI